VDLTTSDGVHVYYEDVGTGPAVLLVHGAASSGRAFDDLTSYLSDQFRVIRIDLRGLGRSERVTSVSATAWCDDVVALLDHLGLPTAHFAGCSLGARIVGRIAFSHRDRVTSLTVDAPLLAVEKSANRQLNTRFSDFDHASEEDIARWQRFHGDDWRDAVSFYRRARSRPDLQEYLTLRPHLSLLDLPTLITRGDVDDDIHPLAHAIEWHRAHPNSWLWVAPSTRFSLMQHRPKEFSSIFTDFVGECATGAHEVR
jgi:pimeloyl-ACP methyl ester carboxylesterase